MSSLRDELLTAKDELASVEGMSVIARTHLKACTSKHCDPASSNLNLSTDPLPTYDRVQKDGQRGIYKRIAYD